MSLASHQLDAFQEVARTLNFSRAAKNLRISQSALSQRILNLESDLGAAILIRDPAGIRLTDTGFSLLRYCQARRTLESEFLASLQMDRDTGLAGVLRLGGYSSVTRSLILPALSELVKNNPRIQLEILVRETSELPGLLRRGEADFVVVDREIQGGGATAHPLGSEEYVLVENKAGPRSDAYLDHDVDDITTDQYLKRLGEKAPVRRSFLDDIYGILDGVELGFGKAVVPRHMLRERKNLAQVKGSKPMQIPVVLHYIEQPYYSKLHQAVVETLTREVPRYLKGA